MDSYIQGIDVTNATARCGPSNTTGQEMRTPHTFPEGLPPDYRGPIYLDSGRLIYWTGRVAIGLRHGAAAGDVRRVES